MLGTTAVVALRQLILDGIMDSCPEQVLHALLYTYQFVIRVLRHGIKSVPDHVGCWRRWLPIMPTPSFPLCAMRWLRVPSLTSRLKRSICWQYVPCIAVTTLL